MPFGGLYADVIFCLFLSIVWERMIHFLSDPAFTSTFWVTTFDSSLNYKLYWNPYLYITDTIDHIVEMLENTCS